MAHEHEVIDKDLLFTIDPDTMEISCAGTVKALKCGDHRAEKYSFSMPRYIEGHDMILCNKVEVHYNNIKYNKEIRETTIKKSFDEVQDFGLSESEDTVAFTWLVSGDATQLEGTLNFCIRFACMDGDKIEYQKFTEIYESIPVGASIWNTEAVKKEYADVLEQWREELMGNGGATDERIADAVEKYLSEHPIDTGSKATIGTVNLLADKWSGSENLYSQVVAIDGVTENSQVDLTPSVEQLVAFYKKDLTFVTEQENGIVTVYAIGQKPENDYTIQVTITEVDT